MHDLSIRTNPLLSLKDSSIFPNNHKVRILINVPVPELLDPQQIVLFEFLPAVASVLHELVVLFVLLLFEMFVN